MLDKQATKLATLSASTCPRFWHLAAVPSPDQTKCMQACTQHMLLFTFSAELVAPTSAQGNWTGPCGSCEEVQHHHCCFACAAPVRTWTAWGAMHAVSQAPVRSKGKSAERTGTCQRPQSHHHCGRGCLTSSKSAGQLLMP
jgi:hypothetical protein